VNDVHPIKQGPIGRTLEERLRATEEALALLWDQVWWMQLPEATRAHYEAEGFRSPIRRFYVPIDQVAHDGD
jgi:hypothetical protein